MATTPKRKVRRLKNIEVRELSLVDFPAVEQARFVIAKRDTDASDVSVDDALACTLHNVDNLLVAERMRQKSLTKAVDAEIARRDGRPTLDAAISQVGGVLSSLSERIGSIVKSQDRLTGRLQKLHAVEPQPTGGRRGPVAWRRPR
jgi:hypothetical protein